MARYEKGTAGAKKHGSSWREWMHGANAVDAINQKRKDDYFTGGKKRREAGRKKYKKATKKRK
jgi:hypothetical protein